MMATTQRRTVEVRGLQAAKMALRVALAVGYLSAVADRFGMWGPPGKAPVVWGNFEHFMQYSARLNPWCPAAWQTTLAWVATVVETGVGVMLLTGLYQRTTALFSGLMALSFAAAMTWVLGVHTALNYSVFVVSAGSFLLASVSRE